MMPKFDQVPAIAASRLLLFLLSLAASFISLHQVNAEGIKILDVGLELLEETLPLKMGQGFYQLRGLKPSTWYEVKISYPASIPAKFSIELRRSVSDDLFLKNRRLLNTEKLVFKAENYGEAGNFVLVSVEAAGVVAKPYLQERENVIFNIVCDELSFGIPLSAWRVGVLAILCIVIAAIFAYSLPLNLLTGDKFDDPNKAS